MRKGARRAFFVAQFVELLTLLLSSIGATVLLVWPEKGPAAWARERILRRVLGATAGGVLDCYVCAGFWAGLALGVAWWFLYAHAWCFFNALMTPAAFWVLLPGSRGKS